mgnify:FL=1
MKPATADPRYLPMLKLLGELAIEAALAEASKERERKAKRSSSKLKRRRVQKTCLQTLPPRGCIPVACGACSGGTDNS